MAKPPLRVVRPEDPITTYDLPLAYSGGKFSNLVAVKRGDRPREVKPGAQVPDHWRRQSAAELAREDAWQEKHGIVTVDLEMMGMTYEEYEADCERRAARGAVLKLVELPRREK